MNDSHDPPIVAGKRPPNVKRHRVLSTDRELSKGEHKEGLRSSLRSRIGQVFRHARVNRATMKQRGVC